jgi:uncharacterized membrane protein
MLLSAAIWLQNTGLMRALRESDRGYETLLALHVSCISLFAAMILLTDLRLLNLAPRGYSVSDIVDQLRVPKRIGFLCVATFGFLMFGMKAEEYYLNVFFRIKVLLFLLVAVHALIFRRRVYNCTADLDQRAKPPVRAQVAAALSLLLWFGIVCAGRGIGYIHPPPFSHHFDLARVTQTPAAPSENDAAVMLPSDSTHSVFQEKGAHDANR